MKTLLLALISSGKTEGTREGAIRGLVGVGKEAVRKGLVEGGGAKLVENEFGDPMEHGAVLNSVSVSTYIFRCPFGYLHQVMGVGCSQRASADAGGSAPRSNG
jgi:transcription initiation factor TFIID subunit 6